MGAKIHLLCKANEGLRCIDKTTATYESERRGGACSERHPNIGRCARLMSRTTPIPTRR